MAVPARSLCLCLEQTLGHRTHGANVEASLHARGIPADIVHVEQGRRGRLPWALEGSRRARAQVRSLGRAHGVTFFHTQTIALFARQAVQGHRYVVSVDATPLQYDAVGRWYNHRAAPGPVERLKKRWYESVFRDAAGLVAWSNWAGDSLVQDYGADAARVFVAHPGAPDSLFAIERQPRPAGRIPRILFVGGDFERKGGPGLLAAFRRLAGRAELVLMTDAEVPRESGIRVLRGVRPGTPEFLRCFADADLFCLPTLGDCTPVAIGEAMAAGLPVVTTAVGSNEETVSDGAGFVLPAGDETALAETLARLIDDGALRDAMGRRAREVARDRLSASRNGDRLVSHLLELAQ
jgi:glycosyltransferase involved in cell wall biosynthesis